MMKGFLRNIILTMSLTALAVLRVYSQAIPDGDIVSPAKTQSTPEEEQGIVDGIEAGFVKNGEELPPGVMFFNVFKLKNHGEVPLEFEIKYDIPDRCKTILQDADQGKIVLKIGESRFIPIRVSFPADAEGGIVYPIIARLERPDGSILGKPVTTQVTYQKISKWRITTPLSKTYSSSGDESYTSVFFTLYNQGNTKEMISLDYQLGDLLEMEGAINNGYIQSFPLRPSTDTVVEAKIRCKPYGEEESPGDRNRLRLIAKSNNSETAEELMVIFESIRDSYRLKLNEAESPLIVTFNQSDLGSEETSTNINLSGNILLKGEREISYMADFQNSFFAPNPTSAGNMLWKNARFMGEYRVKEDYYRLGDVSGGIGVSAAGRGVSIGRTLGDTKISGTLVSSVRNPNWGAALSLKRKINDNLQVLGALTYKQDKADHTKLYAPSAGFNLNTGRSGKSQYLSFVATATKLSTYGRGIKPIEKQGIGYQLNYNASLGEWKIGLKNTYASREYQGNGAGVFQLDGEAAYKFANNSSFKLTYSGVSSAARDESEDGEILVNSKQTTQKINMGYNFLVGGKLPVSLAAGMDNMNINRDIYSLDTTINFGTRNTRFAAGTMIKSKNNSDVSFSPSIQIGMTQITQANDREDMNQTSFINAKAGFRANLKNGSVSADYQYAPRMSSAQAAYEGEKKNIYAKTIGLGTSYEWELMPKTLLLDASGSASYNVDENILQSNLAANLRYEREDGWNFKMGVNLDPSRFFKRKDGTPTTLSELAAFSFGAQKVFDMPQPRLKYYTLMVVFFKDLNGNKLLEKEDEPGVGNVMVGIERAEEPIETEEGIKVVKYIPPGIMSDQTGTVSFYRVPEGHYMLTLTELFAPMQYTNMSGTDLEVTMNKHITLFVPYSKSVTIEGKVEITRDKYSRVFGVTPANIRVTVTDKNGDIYHSLTDERGNYVITVPYSEHYTVSMKNVLGTKFDLVNADQELDVKEDEMRFQVNFHFKEKGRSVNFGG
ncbi:MAG: hypothetical protein SF052_22480 [Bacteroidia bacterium]|nr:hypothetical protein [Bacteroidia bacterium]